MTEREHKNVEHAQWRVAQASWILKLHGAMRTRAVAWKQQQAGYLKSLAEAEEALQALRDAPV